MAAQSLPALAPDAFRRPRLEIELAGAAATDYVERCVIERGILPHADRASMTLAASGPGILPGDSGSIDLGYEDSETSRVFTGEAVIASDDVSARRGVTLASGSAKLARLRVNASYERQNAGAIVSDLAQRAGVDTGTLEAGPDFPAFVVDDRRSLLDHVAALARRAGFIAYFDVDGALQFRSVSASPSVQRFRYGVDILALRESGRVPSFAVATVIGEGAAGSSGQNAWNWLLKDAAPVTATAGTGGATALQVDAALRSLGAAQGAADGALAFADRAKLAGELLAAGAPLVEVGSTIEISDVPRREQNGSRLVLSVLHRFDKTRGFASLIRFSAAPGAGAGVLEGLP